MAPSEVLLARQPIFDPHVRVVGYELLYRTRGASGAIVSDGDMATASVAVHAALDIGLDNLVGRARAWINVTRNGFVQGAYRFLPRDRVVLETLEDIRPDTKIIDALASAKSLGYELALDDFVLGDVAGELIELADVVKVDLPRLDADGIERHAESLLGGRARLLAEKVETYEVFDRCRRAGFQLFQGYFFARPQTISGHGVPAARMPLVNLLARVQDPDVEIEEISQLVSMNVGLSYNLLRYVNSVVFSVPQRIESVRHAVNMLGLTQVRNCVTMLALAGLADKPWELLVTALVRANYCEVLGTAHAGIDASKSFTVGLLSVLDALLDRPMESVIEELGLAPEITAALLRRAGPLGHILDTAVACEQAEWEKLAASGFEPDELRAAYVRALDHADQVSRVLR